MSDDVQVWFVHREYTDKGLITLEYATPEGDRKFVQQISPSSPDPPAARDVPESNLQSVEDDATIERYREEVARIREKHEPDDLV